MAAHFQTTLMISGIRRDLPGSIPVFVNFTMDTEGDLNFSEVSIAGHAFDEGFLHPAVDEQIARMCREYAAGAMSETLREMAGAS